MKIVRSPAVGLTCFGLALMAAGCGGGPPPVEGVTVAANPENVCSAVVTFTVPGASTAKVVATGGGDHLTTPDFVLDGDGQGSITVLGLAASTDYEIVVEAQVQGAAHSTAPVAYTTAALPSELQGVTVTITPGSGVPRSTGYYLVEALSGDVLAFDGAGVIRWYHPLAGSATETKMQPDGTFTTFIGNTDGYQPVPGRYDRYSPDGTTLASYSVASPDPSEPGMPPVYTDPHELQITKDEQGVEHLHMIGFEMRPISPTDSTVNAWHEVVRQSPDGDVEFRWKSWSRFTSADQNEAPGVGDIDHLNALSFDPSDSNYIVSERDLDAVVKIDQSSGDVLWQIGGFQSTMKVVNDPMGTFYAPHDAHLADNGNLLVFDNGLRHKPRESRAAEYAIDAKAKTAKLIWQYRHDPPIYDVIFGSVIRLSGGNTLVAFGLSGIVDEVDRSGKLVWEGTIEDGGAPLEAYRVLPLGSLYRNAPM